MKAKTTSGRSTSRRTPLDAATAARMARELEKAIRANEVVAHDYEVGAHAPQDRQLATTIRGVNDLLKRIKQQLERQSKAGAPPRTKAVKPHVTKRILALRKSGCDYQLIATTLNAQGWEAPDGGIWYRQTVERVVRQNRGLRSVTATFKTD